MINNNKFLKPLFGAMLTVFTIAPSPEIIAGVEKANHVLNAKLPLLQQAKTRIEEYLLNRPRADYCDDVLFMLKKSRKQEELNEINWKISFIEGRIKTINSEFEELVRLETVARHEDDALAQYGIRKPLGFLIKTWVSRSAHRDVYRAEERLKRYLADNTDYALRDLCVCCVNCTFFIGGISYLL